MTPDDPFSSYKDGQDVPTIVAIGHMNIENKTYPMPMCIVDYSLMPDSKDWAFYEKSLEDMWQKDEFRDGFNLVRHSDETVEVQTKRRFAAIGFNFKPGETHQIEAPYFFVTLNGYAKDVEQFYTLLEERKMYLFHLRTERWSYCYFVAWPEGTILDKKRLPKIKIDTPGRKE